MKIEELVKQHTENDAVNYESLIRDVIDECMFAFLVSLEVKFNPITAKNILLEHFELETEDD
jgi:hypothetical protein